MDIWIDVMYEVGEVEDVREGVRLESEAVLETDGISACEGVPEEVGEGGLDGGVVLAAPAEGSELVGAPFRPMSLAPRSVTFGMSHPNLSRKSDVIVS